MRCLVAEALAATQDWDGLTAHFQTCPACQAGLQNLAEAVQEMDALVQLEEAWAEYKTSTSQEKSKEDEQD